jgi:hypothetical protein
MPQICDMGQMALLPCWRKACWGFFCPKNPTASAGSEPTILGKRNTRKLCWHITSDLRRKSGYLNPSQRGNITRWTYCWTTIVYVWSPALCSCVSSVRTCYNCQMRTWRRFTAPYSELVADNSAVQPMEMVFKVLLIVELQNWLISYFVQ